MYGYEGCQLKFHFSVRSAMYVLCVIKSDFVSRTFFSSDLCRNTERNFVIKNNRIFQVIYSLKFSIFFLGYWFFNEYYFAMYVETSIDLVKLQKWPEKYQLWMTVGCQKFEWIKKIKEKLYLKRNGRTKRTVTLATQ